MGCLCTKTTELGVGSFNFEKIDKVHHMPDMEPYEKKKVQEVWRDIESAGLKDTLGLAVFDILFELRPRLILFFTSAVINPDPDPTTEEKVYAELASPRHSFSQFRGLILSSKKRVIWKDQKDSKTHDSDQMSVYSMTSFFSAKQSNQSFNKQKDDLSANSGSELFLGTAEAVLANEKFQTHITKVVEAISSLIHNLEYSDRFANIAFRLQRMHRNWRINLQRFVGRDDFQVMMVAVDEAISILLKSKYVGRKRRSMRHFLEILYFMMTYNMPDETFEKLLTLFKK